MFGNLAQKEKIVAMSSLFWVKRTRGDYFIISSSSGSFLSPSVLGLSRISISWSSRFYQVDQYYRSQ